MANLKLKKLLTDPREGVGPKDKISIYVVNSDGDVSTTIKLRNIYDSKTTKVLSEYGDCSVEFAEYDILNKKVFVKVSI